MTFSIRRLLLLALPVLLFFRRSNLLKINKPSHSSNIHNVRRWLYHATWSTPLCVNLVIIISLRCRFISPLVHSSIIPRCCCLIYHDIPSISFVFLVLSCFQLRDPEFVKFRPQSFVFRMRSSHKCAIIHDCLFLH